MTSIALKRTDVIVGVDTHKDQHVAVALDGLGGNLAEPLVIDATNEGYAILLDWAEALGDVHGFGVEGCGSYGIGLARFLRRHGRTPLEVSRPPRAGERRASGKSTPSMPSTLPEPFSRAWVLLHRSWRTDRSRPSDWSRSPVIRRLRPTPLP